MSFRGVQGQDEMFPRWWEMRVTCTNFPFLRLEFAKELLWTRTKMAEPEPESEPEQAKLETFSSFACLVSPLILRALADLGFSRPTRVQQQAIPLALENSDILARAPTGSGKTAAYCIPLIQKLLNVKAVGTLHGGDHHPVHHFSCCSRALLPPFFCFLSV